MSTAANHVTTLGEGRPEPTFEEMLAAFDPTSHGGEVMADTPVGVEASSPAPTIVERD